jgi:hypothetical protein
MGSLRAGLPKADLQKMQYSLDACRMENPFKCDQQLEEAVEEASK